MSKQRGGNPKRGNHTLDVIKPPGWVGPETTLQELVTRAMLRSYDDMPELSANKTDPLPTGDVTHETEHYDPRWHDPR